MRFFGLLIKLVCGTNSGSVSRQAANLQVLNPVLEESKLIADAVSENFNPDDILHGHLEERHRDAMLDLVLAWAKLDGALGMLLSCVLDISLADGAERIGKLPGSSKFREIYKILRDAPGGSEAATMVKKHKKSYEYHSLVRNRIAHSNCIGIKKSDPDYILFGVFERHKKDELVLEAIPVQEMHRATIWGREMTKLAVRLVEKGDPT